MQDFEQSNSGEPRWEKIYLLEHKKSRKIQKELLCWHRRLDILVHVMKACERSGGIAPQIFNLGSRWMWAVSLMPWLLYGHEKERTVPVEYEARCAPVLVWVYGRTEKYLVPARNLTIVPYRAPSYTGHTNTRYRDSMLWFKTLTLDVCIHIQVGLNFQRCDFCTAHMFTRYKFSPLICLSYAEFGLCTQLSNKHFELTYSGAVCQPSQHFSLCVVSATLFSLFIQ